jgi:hypothetical protein
LIAIRARRRQFDQCKSLAIQQRAAQRQRDDRGEPSSNALPAARQAKHRPENHRSGSELCERCDASNRRQVCKARIVHGAFFTGQDIERAAKCHPSLDRHSDPEHISQQAQIETDSE